MVESHLVHETIDWSSVDLPITTVHSTTQVSWEVHDYDHDCRLSLLGCLFLLGGDVFCWQEWDGWNRDWLDWGGYYLWGIHRISLRPPIVAKKQTVVAILVQVIN